MSATIRRAAALPIHCLLSRWAVTVNAMMINRKRLEDVMRCFHCAWDRSLVAMITLVDRVVHVRPSRHLTVFRDASRALGADVHAMAERLNDLKSVLAMSRSLAGGFSGFSPRKRGGLAWRKPGMHPVPWLKTYLRPC